MRVLSREAGSGRHGCCCRGRVTPAHGSTEPPLAVLKPAGCRCHPHQGQLQRAATEGALSEARTSSSLPLQPPKQPVLARSLQCATMASRHLARASPDTLSCTQTQRAWRRQKRTGVLCKNGGSLHWLGSWRTRNAKGAEGQGSCCNRAHPLQPAEVFSHWHARQTSVRHAWRPAAASSASSLLDMSQLTPLHHQPPTCCRQTGSTTTATRRLRSCCGVGGQDSWVRVEHHASASACSERTDGGREGERSARCRHCGGGVATGGAAVVAAARRLARACLPAAAPEAAARGGTARQSTAVPRERMSRRRRAAVAPRPAGRSSAHLLCKRAYIQRQHEVGDVGLPGARGQLLGHCGGRRSLPAPAQGQQHEAHQRRLDHRHAGGPPGPLPVLLLGHSSVAGRLPGCWAPRHPGAAAASSGRRHQIAGDGRRPQQVRPAHQSKRVCAVCATPPACKALGAGRYDKQCAIAEGEAADVPGVAAASAAAAHRSTPPALSLLLRVAHAGRSDYLGPTLITDTRCTACLLLDPQLHCSPHQNWYIWTRGLEFTMGTKPKHAGWFSRRQTEHASSIRSRLG